MPEAPHNADPQIRYAVRSGFTGVSLRSTNPEAGGIPSGSRWLSEVTPPVSRRSEIRTPAGVPLDALQPAMLASLQDADSLAIHRPVVSLVPRSTTGYRMESLWDDHAMSLPFAP